MDLQQARTIARSPYAATRSKADEALVLLGKALDRAESHSLEQERRTTLGGIPPATVDVWANERDVPPPASASDPVVQMPQWRDAPRLHALPDGGDAA